MRMTAGVTAEQAAGLLGIDRGKVSNIESGIRTISPERLRALAAACDCTDEGYLAALTEMARPFVRNWWDEYRDKLPAGLLDIAELEWHSVRVQTVQTIHLPDLFHTEDYARTVFASVLPALSRLEVELRVAHRLARQRVLTREQPIEYVAYVHEAALLMRFGGREVTRQQFRHLLAESERENVTVRVIPIDQGIFPGAGQALLYSEGAVPALDTAQLDSAHGPGFTHHEAQLAKYRTHLAWMDKETLPPDQSRDFIQRLANDL
jgi:transcriptional regulator with XRE-family HTH domain